MIKIPLQLIKGDVRDVEDISCLLFGHRCPLRSIITKETDQEFVRKHQKHCWIPFTFEILHSPGYRWERSLSVDYRSRKKVSHQRITNLHLALLYALRKTRTGDSIGIMPFSARNPDCVALETILALWNTIYLRADPYWGYRRRSNEEISFKIISDDGFEPYERILESGYKRMWEFRKFLNEGTDSFGIGLSGKLETTMERGGIKMSDVLFKVEVLEV